MSNALTTKTLEISAPNPDSVSASNLLGVIARAAQDPTIDVDKMERLLGMAERMESKRAERDFATALVALQGETMRVQATKAVDERSDGTCRYRFAPYEEIMAQVQPMLTRHGFSITFDTETGEQRLTSICTLTHSSGHSRSNRFAVRYGKPPGSSEAQGDMSTKSYAKRGALCDALNIVVDHDNDGSADNPSALGENVTPEQAASLRELCEATNSDKSKLLRFAGADEFENIPAHRFEDIYQMLKKKEGGK